MIRKVGRAQVIGVAAILAVFFAAELATRGFDGLPRDRSQAQSQAQLRQ